MRAAIKSGALSVLRAAIALGVLQAMLVQSARAQGIGLEELRSALGWGRGSLILFDQLEYAPGTEGRPIRVDAVGWYGSAYNRLWIRADGDQLTSVGDGEVEAEFFYGRLITPFWDALVGLRVDGQWGDRGESRAHLGFGVTGLAPLRFEFSPTLYLSQDGDLSGQLEAEYQLLITQRLVAAPEIEIDAALQEVPEWGVGSGLNSIQLGLRFRYHIAQEIAPYLGFLWIRRLGESADFARAAGAAADDGSLVAGVRVWR